MNKLSNIDITVLKPSQIKAIEAYACKPISECNYTEMRSKIEPTVGNCMVILGTKRTDIDAELLVDLFIKELKLNFKIFTLEEVVNAIYLGIKGELVDFNKLFVSPISIHAFIKYIRAYNESIRRPAIAEMLHLEENAEREREEKQKAEKVKKFEAEIEEALKLLPTQRHNILPGIRAAMYRHLDKQGRVNLSLEQKNKIYEKAKNMADDVNRRDYNFAADFLNGLKNRDAQIREIAEGLAFLII